MKFPHVLTSETIRMIRRREQTIALASQLPSSAAFPGAVNVSTRTSTAFFPLDPRRELKAWDRKALLQKARYLRNASGVMRALFEKPAKFACPGGLTPSASTPDPDYNAAADETFESWATLPIDVTNKLNFYDSVEMLASNMPCDGEVFPMRVRTLSHRPQLQFLFSHQIGDFAGISDSPKARFIDGVLENSLGRALMYRVLQTGPFGGIASCRDVSAEDMMHVFDPKRLMFSRGVTWAYHGANSELDRLDMRALDGVARKLNLALAAVIKRTGAQGAGIGAKLNASDIAALTAAASGQEVPAAPVADPSSNVTWEQILSGGAVPVLRDGEELQSVDTDRSPESFIAAGENIIRELATGYGVSYEFIWCMASLGGPASRFILEDLNAFCTMLNRILIGRYCQPTRSWVLANAIVHGDLQEPKRGNWWDCIWSGPPKVTIDRGRDGNLFLKLLEKGMLTLEEWWSMLGQDARKMRKKRITEIAEDLSECQRQGVPYHLYIAAAPGTPAAADNVPIIDANSPQLPAMLEAAFALDPALRERLAALLTTAENPRRDIL